MIENRVHALMLYTTAFDPDELKIEPGNYGGPQGKRSKDNNSGLYHLDIGSNRGILKKINFSKQTKNT